MTDTALTTAHRLLEQAADAVSAVAQSGTDDELIAVLALCEGGARRLDRAVVDAVAALERRGTFAERGYKSAAGALGDLLGWERFEARRRVVAAEQVTARVGLDGGVLPARLPATAQVFAEGDASMRHVEMIAKVLGSPAAQRLSPQQWAGVEEQLAAKAGDYSPSELQTWGVALVEVLDQDGEEPDDRPPAQVNELVLQRFRDGGGKLTGRFDDAAMFDAIAAVIDAKAKPVTGDDDRPAGQRQAEALADACGYVLDHAGSDVLPECGGHRPHVNVLIRLDDLENRARAACLDFGGPVSPQALRMLCCDAAVIPIVMNGAGQPLDVGRATRTIPDGLRRAVAARDKGCAHPGCDRPSAWSEVHHIHEWEHGGETKLSNLVTWSCSVVPIIGRCISRTGSSVSATGCRSSSRRNGWIMPRHPAAKPFPSSPLFATRLSDRLSLEYASRGLFRTSEDYFRTRRVAIGDGPLSGRIGFAHSTYRKRTVERVLYHRVLSLRDSRPVRVDRGDPVFHS